MKNAQKTIIMALLAVSMWGGSIAASHAQGDPSQTIIPSLELQEADVREALKALFRTVGVSYSIAPDVQGTVTVSLRNVTFETALLNILKQVDATYRVEGGVYQIIKRPPDNEANAGAGTGPTTAPNAKLPIRRLKIRSADPQFIMLMLSGSQSTGIAPEMSTVSNTRNLGGGGGGLGGGGNGGFGGGGGGLGGGGLGGGGLGGGGLGGGGFGGGGGGFGGGGGGGIGR